MPDRAGGPACTASSSPTPASRPSCHEGSRRSRDRGGFCSALPRGARGPVRDRRRDGARPCRRFRARAPEGRDAGPRRGLAAGGLQRRDAGARAAEIRRAGRTWLGRDGAAWRARLEELETALPRGAGAARAALGHGPARRLDAPRGPAAARAVRRSRVAGRQRRHRHDPASGSGRRGRPAHPRLRRAHREDQGRQGPRRPTRRASRRWRPWIRASR